jgi:hypothetical protein
MAPADVVRLDFVLRSSTLTQEEYYLCRKLDGKFNNKKRCNPTTSSSMPPTTIPEATAYNYPV